MSSSMEQRGGNGPTSLSQHRVKQNLPIQEADRSSPSHNHQQVTQKSQNMAGFKERQKGEVNLGKTQKPLSQR